MYKVQIDTHEKLCKELLISSEGPITFTNSFYTRKHFARELNKSKRNILQETSLTSVPLAT